MNVAPTGADNQSHCMTVVDIRNKTYSLQQLPIAGIRRKIYSVGVGSRHGDSIDYILPLRRYSDMAFVGSRL